MSWFLMNKKTDEKKKKEELRKFFQKAVSVESDGKLSKDQWLNVFIEAKIHNSSDEVDQIFSNTGMDEDGRLSFEEFMGEQSRAERLFRLMDKDGDGYVTKSEFKEVCRNLNKEQIEAAFKRFDQTGNDKLNFREFRDMMNKKSRGPSKSEDAEEKTNDWDD